MFDALKAGGIIPADAIKGMTFPRTGTALFDNWAFEWLRRTEFNRELNRPPMSDGVSSSFNAAQNWTPRRDPLTLDLDGDGLETVAPSSTNPIYFDHDGDGVKNGTGWVKPDDGFLVLDRDGNGTIDSGRELFGDSTPLAAGGNAANGFAALAQEDTNFDGEVDTNDANFSRLRVWRDLNQDGLSQSDELSTLDSLNIAALNVTSTTLPSGIKTKRYLGWPDPCALA